MLEESATIQWKNKTKQNIELNRKYVDETWFIIKTLLFLLSHAYEKNTLFILDRTWSIWGFIMSHIRSD